MTDLRKAAEMALEALEDAETNNDGEARWDLHRAATEALRTALAQTEQEPVAWMGITDNPYCNDADCNDPNGRAMRWHDKLLEVRGQERKDLGQPKNPNAFLKQSEKEVRGYTEECKAEIQRLKQVNQKLTQTLTDLVKALKNTRWSFWQSTTTFRDQFERARIRLVLLRDEEIKRDEEKNRD